MKKKSRTGKSNFEKYEALLADAKSARFFFRLFVGGTKPNSMRALQMIKDICQTHLDGRYQLEVTDVFQSPELVKEFQITAVPTLIKLSPEPVQRFVGDLSDSSKILKRLNLLKP